MPEQPRILYLLTSDVSTIFVRGQLDAMRQAGFDVHLATNFSNGAPIELDDGVTTWHIPYDRDPAPIRDLGNLVATVRHIRRTRPNIVHAGTPKAGLLGMLAAWITRTPIRCYALHGLRYETTTGRRRTLLIILERLACACATIVIADSQSMRIVLVRDRIARPSKALVLGRGSSNGVDIERFAPGGDVAQARRKLGLEQFDTVIGFVGRITHDKGVDDLVEAFRSAFATKPEVGLLLVGSSENADPISARTRQQITSNPRIVHIPWLDNTAPAYTAMDVLAFPSYREGLPNVPLEAQASGVPVVGYASTGTVDAVAHSQLLGDIGDTTRLSRDLIALVDDPVLRTRLGTDAREWVCDGFDRRVVWRRKCELFATTVQRSAVRRQR